MIVLDVECGYCGRAGIARGRSELVAEPGQAFLRATITLPGGWLKAPCLDEQDSDAIVCDLCQRVEADR